MGILFGSGKKAAKIQAKATMDSANMQASADREVARSAVQTQETMIAQHVASKMASDILSKPQGQVDVQLSPDATNATVDPATGRKRNVRAQYRMKPSAGSGIKI